jgi:NADH-quinone oxidoreductase subunit A
MSFLSTPKDDHHRARGGYPADANIALAGIPSLNLLNHQPCANVRVDGTNLFDGVALMVWPLVVYFAFVVFLVTVVVIVSYLLGQRHSERATGEPYEGGIVSEGSARVRFSARYYLVAMFFVIFDLEAVFLFAWASAVRDLGWLGYCEVVVFVVVLVAALIYLWKIGALNWAQERRRRAR